ncbi:Protein of unknown function [Cotesia congregata]|uniref:Tyr recombinase domain-containing protein n=1 Tax=Cotesia congregata TaxID=51543 RepID=A0A8J2HJ02_COTCN|nr:Protein of unknown function [Cotesia congregata]
MSSRRNSDGSGEHHSVKSIRHADSSESERKVTPPPHKKRRFETYRSNLKNLEEQVAFLSNQILGNTQHTFQKTPGHSFETPEGTQHHVPGIADPEVTQTEFLTTPIEPSKVLDLGQCKTEVDSRKVLREACPEKLKLISELQKFGSENWKELRYGNTLKEFLASPGFTDLKVNEKLCYLDKSKDPNFSTERALAGLSNAILEQNRLLKDTLQGIVNWTFSNRENVNPETMHELFSANFGPNSEYFKNSEMLQVVCGKRASCIEARRERLISEAPNKQIQVALRNIPPSTEYLFGKERLGSLIQSLGGPQSWLRNPGQSGSRFIHQRKSENQSHSATRQSHPLSRPAQSTVSKSESQFQTSRPKNWKKETPKSKGSYSFRNTVLRRPACQVSQRVEKARSPRRNSRYNYRFPHPIYRETSSYKQLEIINLQDEKHPSAVGSDKTIDRPEGIRATGTPRFEFHFKDVSYKEIGWGDTPYIRSPEFKQVRGSQVIPIILSHKDSRLSPGRGLDDENRLVTSIPAYSCGGSTSLLFKNPLRGCTATADELALWPLSCAVYVLDDNELDSRNPSFQRRKSRGLPGRFPDCSSKSGGPKISGSHDGKITRNSRLAIEPKQERPTTAEGGPIDPSGVEDWGWCRMTKDWSSQEKDLVRESWRASTLLTYKTPIKKWLAWCREKGMDPVAPRGVDLARFLSHLFIDEKIAYSTILVHKSAITTFCAKRDLSSDFLVKQVLKAISVAKPKETRSSIWDAQILLDWLKLDLPNLSFFEVSRRTATILLLASGRRVHDLTLLKISKESLDNLGNEIILWPSFGSKTDRAEFRQSGWRLSKHENIRICPVTWVRALIKLSEKRRSSQNLEELFITVTGPVKPASRTIIAGWIRSVLKEANIDASPGSVRAAVAFRGWLDNLPIQEILERGNWRSLETFRNHYCKQIERQGQGSQGLLFNNFNPIGRTVKEEVNHLETSYHSYFRRNININIDPRSCLQHHIALRRSPVGSKQISHRDAVYRPRGM